MKALDFIQALYLANEAEVYRQKDNVLIRAHGFAFNSGDSEIDARNFALMNKIIESVSQFPDAKIVVSGHTDNRGGDALNETLSKQRAEKVAAFLSQVGKIDASRIESVGYGKAQPVANNDTSDGRAANRRVEILIQSAPFFWPAIVRFAPALVHLDDGRSTRPLHNKPELCKCLIGVALHAI